jgi:hypothetical protein
MEDDLRLPDGAVLRFMLIPLPIAAWQKVLHASVSLHTEDSGGVSFNPA